MCVCLQTHVFVGARGEHHISSIPHYPIFYSYFVCGHTCAHEYMHDCKCVPHPWRSEGNLQESDHSFYHVSSGDWTKVIRFGHKHFKLLSHLTSPTAFFEMVSQWAWSFLILLDWLASEPPESSCLSQGLQLWLPSPVLVVHTQFLMFDTSTWSTESYPQSHNYVFLM